MRAQCSALYPGTFDPITHGHTDLTAILTWLVVLPLFLTR